MTKNNDGATAPKGPPQVFYTLRGDESDQSGWNRFAAIMRLLGFEWKPNDGKEERA